MKCNTEVLLQVEVKSFINTTCAGLSLLLTCVLEKALSYSLIYI